MARRVAMDEADLSGHAQLHRTALGLRGEQGAHVDARADDAVIARPSAQHLPRTAARIQHPPPRRQTQRRTERGVFVGREWVVNAVGAFGDVEDAGDVHWGKIYLRVNEYCRYLTSELSGPARLFALVLRMMGYAHG